MNFQGLGGGSLEVGWSMPTKGNLPKFMNFRVFQGAFRVFSGFFFSRVFSGCLQGVFLYAFLGYALWTLPRGPWQA